jgi:uncharacterized protein YjhX (UPF0386 family)
MPLMRQSAATLHALGQSGIVSADHDSERRIAPCMTQRDYGRIGYEVTLPACAA